MYKKRIVSLSLLALMIAGCGDDVEQKATGPRPVLVTMTEVVIGVTEDLEGTVGRIESKAEPLVSAEIDGRITRIDAEIGATVALGDPLAQIDPEDYRLSHQSAQADVDRIVAMIRQQQRLVDRYLKLRADE